MATQRNLPRGIRNNNPLNLRISNNQWLGKVKYNTDGQFEQFTSMLYGIRAAIINIRTITRRNKDITLKGLIQIWAPANDGNNVANYVQQVTKLSGIKSDEKITIKEKKKICALVHAMAIVENGGSFLEPCTIYAAYDLLYPG